MAMPGGGPRFRLKLNSSFELCRLYIFLIVNCSLILPKVNSYGVTASAGFGNDDNVPVTRIQSVSGMLTNLPCNITPSSPTDRVNIVLWYKDGLGKPLYSFDLRTQSLDSHGKIWASETNSEVTRAQLHIHSEPTAVLALHGVAQEDAGTYRCRVDFKRSPTRYRKITLDVIVPPSKAIIMDERGMEVQGPKVGAVLEGATLILTCDIIGGWPASSVNWWQDGQLLDKTYEEIIPGKSRNTMKVEQLQRQHRHSEFTCSGNNNNRSQALSKSVILDLYLRPLSVEIHSLAVSSAKSEGDNLMFSGHNESWTCIAYGSYPSPSVSWWIDDRFKLDHHEEVTEDNRTLSTLFLSATREMHGGKLSCKVENPLVPNSEIKASQKLQIHYPPEVSIELGSKLNAVDIREGDDVYFECTIDAFPLAERISWKKDNETLSPNEEEGILINEFSLVLQNVGHHSIGKYMCMATNDAGKGSSQQVFLDVKYSPRCDRPIQTMGVGRNEEARLICHIDSNPPPTSIKWRFNSSTHFATLPPEKFFTDRSKSVASYTPKNEIDYGTLSCWASNEVGDQKRPCVFHVIPAGPPDPVGGCQIKNKTFTTISIGCRPGYNGGLKQYFVAILCPYNSFSKVLEDSKRTNLVGQDKLNCEQEIASQRNFNGPSFIFEHLQHGSQFSLAIFAQNQKGRSLAFVMRAFTLRSAERQVELQEVPGAAPNEHLPAATQVRYLSPGWIGLTILVPLVFCFISAGIFRTISRTRTSSTTSHANNSLLMFKRQSANNEGGATAGDGSCVDEQLQKQAPSSWKAQQPPVMEIAAVDSKESYIVDCPVQNWRPLSTWSASGTTSRLPSKGKYVFASRARRSSIEGRIISSECISPNFSLPPLHDGRGGLPDEHGVHGGPTFLHYTTIPRKLKHVPKDAAAAHKNNGAIGETGSFSAQAQSTFVPPALAQTVMSVTDFHPQHQPPPQMGPQNLGPQKPPKEFADESSSMSGGEGMITTTNVDHHHPNTMLSGNTSDLHLTRF